MQISPRTVTGSAEADAAPGAISEFLADPRHIPQWAAAFADKVEAAAQGGWTVTKGGSSFSLAVVVE